MTEAGRRWALVVLAVHLSQQGWLLGVAAVLVAAAGIVTGRMIAWDWLAVWAVTIGEDNRGVIDATSDNQVRFVFVDNHLLTPELYRLGVVAHVLVIPLLAGAGTVFLRPRR